MSKESTCKHNWVTVKSNYMYEGWAMQDECTECGCVGRLDDKPDENGFIQIVAIPKAKVLDFNEFKARKRAEND